MFFYLPIFMCQSLVFGILSRLIPRGLYMAARKGLSSVSWHLLCMSLLRDLIMLWILKLQQEASDSDYEITLEICKKRYLNYFSSILQWHSRKSIEGVTSRRVKYSCANTILTIIRYFHFITTPWRQAAFWCFTLYFGITVSTDNFRG